MGTGGEMGPWQHHSRSMYRRSYSKTGMKRNWESKNSLLEDISAPGKVNPSWTCGGSRQPDIAVNHTETVAGYSHATLQVSPVTISSTASDLSLCHSLCISSSLAILIFVSLSLSLTVSFCLTLSFSFCVLLCLSLHLSLYMYVSYLPVSFLSLCICFCLSLCISLSFCLYLLVYLNLSLYLSVSLSI